MKQKTVLKITLSLFSAMIAVSSQDCSAQLVHAYPNDQYQMMELPSDNMVFLNESIDAPARGFVLVDNGQGGTVPYVLGEPTSQNYAYMQNAAINNIYPANNSACYMDFGTVNNGTPTCCMASQSNTCERCPCVEGIKGIYLLGLEFAAGRYIAIDQYYGGLSFLALPETPFEFVNPLINMKLFKLEKKKNWAGSFGIGGRHFDRILNKVYGVNLFYDYLDQHGSFNQIGLGFELFSGFWEFHLNGYLPVGKTRQTKSLQIVMFKDNFVGSFRENLNALRGVEMTAGGRWYFADNLNLYVAPGLYFYNNRDFRRNIQGFEGTAELNWNEWVCARVNFSYDRVFRSRVQGVLAINIPLSFDSGCCNECDCCCTCDMLAYPIRRNDLIFLKECCSTRGNWDNCGLPTHRRK
jgi:Inverse autotransporter, beta-domain